MIARGQECVSEDPYFDPFLLGASQSRVINLQYVQNITKLKVHGIDVLFSTASNFTVAIDDFSGRKYTGISENGCAGINGSLLNLVSVVRLQINCTNAFLDCIISADLETELCFPVCRGIECSDNGCGGVCSGCYVPCDGDYCLITPRPESPSNSRPAPSETPVFSANPLPSESDAGTENGLDAGETAGVVLAVLGVAAAGGIFFFHRRRPVFFKR